MHEHSTRDLRFTQNRKHGVGVYERRLKYLQYTIVRGIGARSRDAIM
jgi:hypothetical protein